MSRRRSLHALSAAAVAAAVLLGPAHLAAAAPLQELPSADQLKAALLTANDLGPQSGYTEVPATESPTPGETPTPVSGCDALSALLNAHAGQRGPSVPHAEVELDGQGGNPMVTESLTAEDNDRITADFAKAVDAFKTCHTLTLDAGTPDAVTFDVTPITLGDRQDAPAVRLDGTVGGVRLNAYVGIERFGTVGMAFGFFQRDDTSSQTASMQYRTAVAKVERTLGTTAGSTTPPTAAATAGMAV
ncbi:hypothetical protein VM98_08550 [Streptomyces rubellomurinus subsp. indigoferus]|nr:hypothetical protein VM98_08550 [Streptomyces rubellomurinus subsp. indigoferus]